MRRNRIEVPCSQCGKLIERTPARIRKYANHFCDTACTQAFQKGSGHPRYVGLVVSCAQCGKQVPTIPSKVKNQTNHFCNRICQNQWRSLHVVGENHPRWKGGMATVFCEYCDTLLERYPCALDTSEMFFCDSHCKGNWQSENLSGEQSPIYKKQEVPCTQCGAIILRHPCRLEEHKNHFCTLTGCYAKWLSENRSGTDSPHWNPDKTTLFYGPAWNRIRRAIRFRDGFRCAYCKTTERQLQQAMDIHHIRPLRSFNGNYDLANAPSNLLALCRSCHNRAEHRKIPVQPKLL